MSKRISAAIASASLLLAGVPAMAQTATAPATEQVGNYGENAMFGSGEDVIGYVMLAAVVGAFVWGIIEFASDDDDPNYAPLPVSP